MRKMGTGFLAGPVAIRQGVMVLTKRGKIQPWLRLPTEAVAAPSLAVSKARLDRALSTLLWWKGSLPMAGGWNEMVCEVPSNPNHTVIL